MTRIARLVSVAATFAMFGPVVAHAQMGPDPAGGGFDQGFDSPGLPFVSIDRQDSQSRVGLDIGYVFLENADFPDAVYRFDLHGQFVVSQSAANYLGGYGALPIAWLSVDGFDDQIGIGSAEIGGFFGLRLGGGAEIVLRGGVTLPTGDDDDDGLFANVLGGLARITDFAQVFPRTSALRLSGSYLGQAQNIFYRIDGGMDFPIFDTSDTVNLERDPFLRLNAGVGLGSPQMAGLFELANVANTGQLDDDLGEAFNHVLGLAFRGSTGSGISYHAGLYFPIDDALNDFVNLIVSVGLTAQM